MIEYEGHCFARREDAQWLESSLERGGVLPEGRQTASYLGLMIGGSLTIALLGLIGAVLSTMGY